MSTLNYLNYPLNEKEKQEIMNIENNFNLIKFNELGIGDWGLGIGDWGLGPIPNPQSPIPKINLMNNNLNKFIY